MNLFQTEMIKQLNENIPKRPKFQREKMFIEVEQAIDEDNTKLNDLEIKYNTLKTEGNLEPIREILEKYIGNAQIDKTNLSPSETINAARGRIISNYKQLTRRRVAVFKERLEKKHASNQKRDITSIMEGYIPWSGLTNVRDDDGITTDPKGIKEKAAEFFQIRMSPKEQPETPPPPPLGHISDDDIKQAYIPDPSIRAEIWEKMFENISPEEVKETIESLPKEKGPWRKWRYIRNL
jgi:hypothetical protein